MLADGSMMLPISLYATLPLWPLLGAILIGLLLMTKARPAAASNGRGHGQSGANHDDHGHGGQGHGSNGVLGYAHWPVLLGVAVSAVLAVTLFFDLGRALDRQPLRGIGGGVADTQRYSEAELVAQTTLHSALGTQHSPNLTWTAFNWISLGSAHAAANQWVGMTFFFDGLSGVMMLVVCVVSLMVVWYSVGYMRDHHWQPERGYERFFAFLGLFVFSMAMLVLGGNFVLLYLGWELVGLCSYLLIGFYYKKPEAAAAAKKAFIVNRIGDLGFALGIFAIYYYLGMGHAGVRLLPGENPLDYSTVFKYAEILGRTESWFGLNAADMISLLLLCGALGKSAQFPLYVWLPDAMEGPSPVSALIHAATMVTAGVYMIARCGPLYAFAPNTMEVVAVIGAFGAIFAASMAMAQYDMKRIMAYSTMSQLAFMFVALACAAPDAAIFHLYTHAFFKALLFLTAGNVMHAMGGVIDLRQFSGLRRILPITYWLMLVGCMALAGVPLLAGFWSKDTILHAAFFSEMGHELPWLGWVMLLSAGMTAYYTFRMFFLCFNGPERLPKEAGDHPHEMPGAMLRPLFVLGAGAVLAGYLGVTFGPGGSFLGLFEPHGYFHEYVKQSSIKLPHGEHGGGAWVMYLSIALSLGAIFLAWVRYGSAPQDEPDRKLLGPIWNLWNAKYYVDELYERVFVQPLRRLGEVFFATDNNLVDGVVHGVAAIPSGLGFLLRFFQRGALQSYSLAMVIGLLVLLTIWTVS